MKSLHVSGAIIRRLPRYYRYLGELKKDGVTRISSGDLSDIMGVTASQIRQDLNHFGGFGQQGFGYRVEYLYDEIGKILGMDRVHHVIMIGAGNLGTALANHSGSCTQDFVIDAIFDSNAERIGKRIRGLRILSTDSLEKYLASHDADIAAIAVPREEATGISERLVASGVKAIWNFSHVDLKVPEDVVVENVHLYESLMSLSYKAKAAEEKYAERKETT